MVYRKVFQFYNYSMENSKKNLVHIFLKIIKWIFFVLVSLYIILVIVRVFHFFNLDKTNEQVEVIHSTKITMDDVMGTNLPPDPGEEGNKTIAGIDANKNNIRDDVELAIFKEYPNSAKTRAALLQYAFALQRGITQKSVNKTLATEISREVSRGSYCIGLVIKEGEDSFNMYIQLSEFARRLVFNTDSRKKMESSFFEKVRSYSELGKYCDLDYLLLEN